MTQPPIIPEGAVIITPAQMYQEQRAIHDEVKALSQKFDSLVDNTVSKVDDHETRLRILEKRGWVYVGGILVVGPALSYVIELLAKR